MCCNSSSQKWKSPRNSSLKMPKLEVSLYIPCFSTFFLFFLFNHNLSSVYISPWWVRDTQPRSALQFLMTAAPYILLWDLESISDSVLGQEMILTWAEATSVWRSKVKCRQCPLVKPNEGNRSLCSSLPTELMASQNLLPLLVTWATEIRNCFQEHKIECCLSWSCVQWEKEATETMILGKPWTITLCASSDAGSWSLGVIVQIQSICSAGIATCMCKITSELGTWVLDVTVWSVVKISTWKELCGP